MQIFGFPTDLRSQINRKRLRFWVAIIVIFHGLFIASRVDTDQDDDTQDTEFIAQ